MRTRFIVNPESARGAARRKWPAIQRLLESVYPFPFETVFSRRPGQETELAREGIRKGCERIISVGGDGTLNGVLNGFFHRGSLLGEGVALGMIAIGTGGDFTRTLGFPSCIEEAVRHLSKVETGTIDVGRARFLSLDGNPATRYFINILDFGIGGAVVGRMCRTPRWLSGRTAFLWSILATLARYRNKTIRYRLDGREWKSMVLNNFIVANGRYFGSGLLPAPQAQLDDGLFDVVLFGDVGRWEAVRNLRSLRAGTHLSNPHVHMMRARQVEAESEEPVLIDMDGDLVGRLPIEVSVIPGVLPVLK